MCTQVRQSSATNVIATMTAGARGRHCPRNWSRIATMVPPETTECVAKSSSTLTLRLTEINRKCEWSVTVDGKHPVTMRNVTSDLVSVDARRCVPVKRNSAMIRWLCRRPLHLPHAQDFYCCWVDCYIFEFAFIAPTSPSPSPKNHIVYKKKIIYHIFILADVSNSVLVSNED